MKNIYSLMLLVMILWGFNVSALKILVSSIDPILLTSFRIFVAGIGVLAICYFLKIFRLPTKKELAVILYIAIFNVITHHILIAAGIKHTSGVNSGLILGTGPLVIMIFSIIFINKNVTFMKIFGFILGFVGVIFTSYSPSAGISNVSIGDLFIFLGVIVQAISFILISKLNPKFDPRLLTGYMLVLGSIVIFIVTLLTGTNIEQITKLLDWKLGSIFLFSALFATAFGHMMYNNAVKKVGPAETAIFINLNTFFALLGSVLFLGENIYMNHIIGLLFIIFGVVLGIGVFDFKVKKEKQKNMQF